jgi:hypothetical protein
MSGAASRRGTPGGERPCPLGPAGEIAVPRDQAERTA